MKSNNLVTIKQAAVALPAFSEASLRWLVFHEATNGFNRVVVRVGRRVLLDMAEFDLWVDAGRKAPQDNMEDRYVGLGQS